uniref:Uncharacterized protein n=1 Tax=Graphocephala atropunctata TaxID=36148 RepID=A0A1B6KYJ2_9HEMI
MPDPCRSDDIRDLLNNDNLLDDVSEIGSDISAVDVPNDDDVSLEDFSSESDDDYEPRLSDLGRPNSTESEESASDSDIPLAQRNPSNVWVRVLPPETELNAEEKFLVRRRFFLL